MEKIITYENLRRFTYSNDRLIKGEVQGIVLSFLGLGFSDMIKDDPAVAVEYAERGVIYLIPYYNPWCWMNRNTVAYVDEIVGVLCAHYGLHTPKIVSTGVSMGGLCALVYCAYATVTPVRCVTNCPVCDLVYHFDEREDLPRTLYSAFLGYGGTMEEALSSVSPVYLASKMPRIPYTVFHCEADAAVNIERHSVRFVEAMRPYANVTLVRVPARGHGDLSEEAKAEYKKQILGAFFKEEI